jgi:hypothetical protein
MEAICLVIYAQVIFDGTEQAMLSSVGGHPVNNCCEN